MLSAYICLGIGLGALFLYEYVSIVKFAEGWHTIILYVSILGGVCYFLAEKFLSNELTIKPHHTIKLTPSRLLLVCSFGGVCGVVLNYHSAFVDYHIKNVLMPVDWHNTNISYYYYTLIASIVPVAKFVYKENLFTPLKIAAIATVLSAVILGYYPKITRSMYIYEQIIFGFLAAVLLAPCHALVYQLFKSTQNYFEGMFWFVTCFTLFAVTPDLFVKLIGPQSLPWLGMLYIAPIALLFIFALSKCEKELRSSEF